MVNHWLQSTNHAGVLENGPKFHKNGQMAFINTYFPYFMGFLFLLSFKITQKVSFDILSPSMNVFCIEIKVDEFTL